MPKHLDIFIPIFKPTLRFEEKWFKYFDESMSELVEFLNGIKLEFQLFPSTSISAFLYDDFTADKRINKHWRVNEISRAFNRHCFLHLKIPYEITKEHEKLFREWNPNKKTPKYLVHAFIQNVLCDEIERYIKDILIAVSIAKPGGITSTDEVLFFDRFKLLKKSNRSWIATREVKFAINKLEWPVFLDLDLIDVWKWLANFNYDSNPTRIKRALSAYSYLFSTNSISNDTSLIWAVMGIEALYTTGNTGLLNQIQDKSELILGKPTKYKKHLSAMYAFRSKLIHGAADLPRKYHDKNIEDKFEREYNESSNLAVAILLTTLQYLAKNNIQQFEFSYKFESV